jgi:glycosyltransferase involved in cell wall biosynthesis
MQYLIQSLPLLDEDLSVSIVGKGPYKHRLVKLADKLRLGNRVRFYQDLPRRELLKMYAKAGVFVLLSRGEAFGNAIAEALAARTPCIVATTSALKERVDNKNCFGIEYPINSDELAKLINRVIGKEVADVKLWDWTEVVEQIRTLYEN